MNQLQTVLDALDNGLPEARKEAIAIVKQMMQAEPVLYQRRMKPDYGPDWTHWDDCSEATFKECLRVPKLHDWTHESRALYAAPQAVPAGWKLVPVEPTTKMLDAMTSAWLVGATSDMALREYKAMLAASPKGAV